MENRKVYYHSGDLVVVKHDLPSKPIMLVQSVDKTTMQNTSSGGLLGVTCIWFDKNNAIQKHRFSTKDIQHYEK